MALYVGLTAAERGLELIMERIVRLIEARRKRRITPYEPEVGECKANGFTSCAACELGPCCKVGSSAALPCLSSGSLDVLECTSLCPASCCAPAQTARQPQR